MRYVQKIILFIALFVGNMLGFADSSISYEIVGITGKPLKNISEHLANLKDSFSDTPSATNNQIFYHRAPEIIREALQPYGYFKANIHSEWNGNKMVFKILPGSPIILSHVTILLKGPGKNNPLLQNFIEHFPLKRGDSLDIKKYEAAKEKLYLIATEQGYLKATLEKKEIRIFLKKYSAEIIWEMDTGPQYYFGSVKFQPSAYSDQFLQRFVPLKPHETFSTEKLMTFQQALSNSRYFQRVSVTPEFNSATGEMIPINIDVAPPKSQRYDFGVGYGTATGPRLTLGADFRRVTNTGQRFTTELKLSSVLNALTAKYYIPGRDPLTEQYTLGGNIQSFTPKNGSSFSQSLFGNYMKNVKEWQNTLGLNVLNERYRVEEKPIHQSQVLYPSWTLTRIKSDNPIYPRFGNMLSLTLQGANTALLSESNFFQGELKGKTIFSPTKNSRLIFRGDLGYTIVDNLNQLPLTLRYFAGGLGSVRGYPFSSIGPGKYLEVASMEFQHKIYGKWNGAVFYDVGNASDTFNGNFKRGQGVGIIYRSLIGPIQLYVGQALTKKDKPYTIEFNIGPDF